MEFLFSGMKSIVDKLVAPLWNFDDLFYVLKILHFKTKFSSGSRKSFSKTSVSDCVSF